MSPFLYAVRSLLVFAVIVAIGVGVSLAVDRAIGMTVSAAREVAVQTAPVVMASLAQVDRDSTARIAPATMQPAIWYGSAPSMITPDLWIDHGTVPTLLGPSSQGGREVITIMRRSSDHVREVTVFDRDHNPVCSFDERGVNHHATDVDCARLLVHVLSVLR